MIAVIALPATWFAVELHRVNQTQRVARATLEARHCSVLAAEKQTQFDAFLAKLFSALGPDEPYPIGYVDASQAEITDADLVWIEGLGQLWYLDVTGTSVTDAGLDHLRGFPQLKAVFLGNTQVTDAGMPKLQQLTGLECLFLDGNRITDAGIRDLSE